jgi:hypothetical protein
MENMSVLEKQGESSIRRAFYRITGAEDSALRKRTQHAGKIRRWRIDEAWSLEHNYQHSKNQSTSALYVSASAAWSF